MKKYDVFKTIHLVILVALAILSLVFIFTSESLFHMIAVDDNVRKLAILLWLCLVVGFAFIFLDYSWMSRFKKEYRELDFAVNSDPLSGIANRNSCDAVIESYFGKDLPKNLCCLTMELTSLKAINAIQGRAAGNAHIQHFSTLLQAAARDLCFVGRNGGMCFLAIFEEGSEGAMEKFLTLLNDDILRFNERMPDQTITFRYGFATQEKDCALTITELVSLSSHRCAKAN